MTTESFLDVEVGCPLVWFPSEWSGHRVGKQMAKILADLKSWFSVPYLGARREWQTMLMLFVLRADCWVELCCRVEAKRGPRGEDKGFAPDFCEFLWNFWAQPGWCVRSPGLPGYLVMVIV